MKISFIFTLFILLNSLFPALAQITPGEASALMQRGINLGNTLEPPLEGGWNNPAAQEYYFDLYKDAGFNTVRIPVRWDEHTQDSSPYMINESWLQRVEQIIDWGLSRDLFIVINAHHEEWIKQNYTNVAYRDRFDSIWSQIAVRFQAKSEKLLFEIINEPYGLTKTQNNELHQRILSIIRKTNPTRIVIFQGHNWGGSDELIASAIPDDEYIMGSFHSYDPYLFGLEGQGTWGTSADYAALQNKFISVKNWSDTSAIPVFLGEFGSLRTCDYNSRMKHYRAYVELSQKYGFVACAWDDGGDFRIMERSAHMWDEVKDILIHTNALSPKNLSLITQDTMIIVSWVNPQTDYDSIIVEHRTPTGSWIGITRLKGDTSGFAHYFPGFEDYHYYRIVASKNSGEQFYSQPMRVYLPAYTPKTRSAYLGHKLPIPGVIEAEDFDIGGEGLTYHDITASNMGGAYRPDEAVDVFSKNSTEYFLGSIVSGEWCEYSVSVADDGLYKTDFHVAALMNGGTFQISVDTVLSRIITAKNTGSRLLTTILSDTMDLKAGEYIMRLNFINDNSSSYNIDKLTFSKIQLVNASKPIAETPFQLYQLSPNNFMLDFEGDENITTVQLYSIEGKLLLHHNNPGRKTVIPAHDIPPGIYIFRLETNKNIYSKKLIIK